MTRQHSPKPRFHRACERKRRSRWHAKDSRVIAFILATWTLIGTITAQTGSTLYSFTGGYDGSSPVTNLVLDKSGNLYGSTIQGGVGPCAFPFLGCGTIFELTPVRHTWRFQLLYSFQGGNDGAEPSTLAFDTNGNLYGTTFFGGSAGLGCGTIFELKPSAIGWHKIILYRFACGADGGSPNGPLVMDFDGNIFGTTAAGGDPKCSCGTVFELKKPSVVDQEQGQWSEVVLHAFVGTDGANPMYGLTLAPPNLCHGGLPGYECLFGTTPNIGDDFETGGTIFELLRGTDSSWNFQVIVGAAMQPGGPLVFDEVGTLYGIAAKGGYRIGCVFQLTPTGASQDGWIFTTIYSFGEHNPDGFSSWYQGLSWDKSGNLYGATWLGGEGDNGTVFRLSRRVDGAWYESDLYSLPGGAEGAEPYDGVVVDSNGNIYGTTAAGGDLSCPRAFLGPGSGCGVVFQVSP